LQARRPVATSPLASSRRTNLGLPRLARQRPHLQQHRRSTWSGGLVRLTEKTVLRGGYWFFYPTSAAQGVCSRPCRPRISYQDMGLTGALTTRARAPSRAGAGRRSWHHSHERGVLGALTGLTSGTGSPLTAQPRIPTVERNVRAEVGWRTAVRLSYLGSYMSVRSAYVSQSQSLLPATTVRYHDG